MRWDNLKIEQEEGAQLPGFRDPAVIRTFDAPEALGTRFYEVNARSAINKVPERSRMPFRHTINPYRGCAHACTYCVHGDTQILMASGRTKPMREVRAGDSIYGTRRDGRYRRYVKTRVLAHWETLKKPYRVTLEDGTTLVASGDHRFLTDRGWKHVAGSERGRWRRPHLTLDDKLIGYGAVGGTPAPSPEYRRGYLCGLIRADGTIGHYGCERRGRASALHSFRLALTDFEALRRAQLYLGQADVALEEQELATTASAGSAKPVRMLRTGARGAVELIEQLAAWPERPSDDWSKGFLAGIFDAEGSNSRCLRVASTEREIIDRTNAGFRRFGFDTVVEDPNRANGLSYIRLRGGLRERLRFLQLADPAITRKRSVEGIALTSGAELRVEAIQPLAGKTRLYDVTTGSGDFIANGVVSHNCFARPTHTYLDFNAREDFEREIVVKVNVPELVRAELRKPSWQGAHVALGTNTDPYQWVEGRYKLLPGIWEAMRDFANPCSLLTKSPLLLRDLPLFKELVERTEFVANLSIPTLEEKAWRATEPHTPHPRKRIEAVAELSRNGIPTGVLVAPLIPGVNDDPKQVEELFGLLGEAGARSVSAIGLHLRGEVREIWFDWLRQYRPDLVSRYEELYRRGAYLPKQESQRLRSLARGWSRLGGLRRGSRGETTAPREAPAPEAQPTLF